jgi:hypothetical protein
VPTPRYFGAKKLNLQITRDRSQELYCVAQISLERLDGSGGKDDSLGGDRGSLRMDIPTEWKSLAVHVFNPAILPASMTEPPVATPPAPWLASPVPFDKCLASVVFNYKSQTQAVQIQTSEEAMKKQTDSIKETSSWNINLKLGGEVLSELVGQIPGIGSAKKVFEFTPELSGGMSGSTETGSTSEQGATVGQKKTWTVTVSYVDFTVPPEVYINGMKQ